MSVSGRWLPLGIVLVLSLFLSAQPVDRAGAQTQPLPSPVQGAQTWQIQVDNLSPAGHVWNFNSFYPNHFQAHVGDTISFTLAMNANAFHAIAILPAAVAPDQGYQGFVFPDADDPEQPLETNFFNVKPFFGAKPSDLCGRNGSAACDFDSSAALKSGVLVNPPQTGGGEGNTSFVTRLDPSLATGTYFFICLVHGPAMSGSFEVLPPEQPAQSAALLQADAARAYQSDLDQLTQIAPSIQAPGVVTNVDGSRQWTLAAGGGAASGRLSIDEFGVPSLIIHAGDTVTWTNQGPAIVPHTVTGFAAIPDQSLPALAPFQPVCGGPDPNQNGETDVDTEIVPGQGFPPDIWNSCPPWQQEEHLTQWAFPSAPSGTPLAGTSVTSGLLLSQDFLTSAIGLGAPFASTYTVAFPRTGSYAYACMIHRGMLGMIIVQ